MKKGQSAIEITVLILLLMCLIIGYVILAPQDVRDELLDDTRDGDSDGGDGATSGGSTLYSVSPGEVEASQSGTSTTSLQPIRIYSTVESESETIATSLKVSRNLLQNNYKTFTFSAEDTEDLDSLSLLFMITESKGDLIVKLNDNIVYEGELTSNNLPLSLPVSVLEEINVLELSTSSPGLNIFSADYYLLQDVTLVKEYVIEDTTKERTFYVSDPGDVSNVALSYFITCNSDEEGRLTIYLNNREEFSDLVFCEYLDERELVLDTDYLTTSNTLTFEIDQGDYNLDEVDLEITSKGLNYPSYSFDIDSDLYDDISAGEKEVYLELSFGDDSSEKKATVYLQDHSFSFDTTDDEYSKKISSYIDNGNNVIKLVPTRDFEITNLKITYE
tara:strand:+ start:2670 stop:3836 length:1167 start_codon:yes stop_codon:yes gene_type:complete